MSAQERKEAGTTGPVTPQRPEGRLSRFLNKLFGEPSTLQTPPRIVQPPPGLEDFAAKIQQGIDGHLATARQQELERRSAEAVRIAAETEKQALLHKDRESWRDQEKTRKEKAFTEASKILNDLHIEEKLEYIKQRYWAGQGELRVSPLLGTSLDGNELQGGFELGYRYKYPRLIDDGVEYRERPWSRRKKRKIVFNEKSTKLEIALIDEQGEKVIRISSVSDFDEPNASEVSPFDRRDFSVFKGKRIPINENNSEALLDAAIAENVVHRVKYNLFPAEIKKAANRMYESQKRHLFGEWEELHYDGPD